MKFIHFGCWGELNKTTKVINVLQNIKHYVDTNPDTIKFITIAGDNYYPKKEKLTISNTDKNTEYKVKIYNNLQLNQLMDYLKNVSIPKYLLWGNHDMLDKTITPIEWEVSNRLPNIEERIITIENQYKKECMVINGQLDWIKNNDKQIIPFKQVIINLSFPNTLILMIDTTIYEEDEYSKCYNTNNIFDSKNNKYNIDNLRNIQLSQIIQALMSNVTQKHIIFIGHHPIKSWKKKGIVITTHLYSLFSNLTNFLTNKTIYYLCADTHLYQHSKLYINNNTLPYNTITIEQFVVGTGGAETDKLGKLTEKSYGFPVDNIDDRYDIMIYEQKKEHGFLVCEYREHVDQWFFSFQGGIIPDTTGGKKKYNRNQKKTKTKTKKHKTKTKTKHCMVNTIKL